MTITSTPIMTPELTATTVALKDLTLHELNARAGSPETYEAGDIAALAASIATLGLLNPLIVQKADKMWGVIAGGRRLAALRHLAGDKAAKGWTQRSRIACRAIGDDVAAATAITVAENVTQKAMDPLDEFEAFARMMEVGGHDPESIARLFGVERRRVVERLRYGRVHPVIRAAARAKSITLDAMKAFAEHPDRSVQFDTFEALRGAHMQAWTIRDRLKNRGVKLGDAVAQLVIDDYRAADGEIVADLIEEDSILCDETLVEELLLKRLAAHAAVEAEYHGFAWSEARRECDYDVLRDYGRVYPVSVDPQGEDAKRCEAVALRLAQLDEDRDGEDGPDIDALEEEYEALNGEYERLTTGWASDDLARAGVMAFWDGSGIRTIVGLVRPEDRRDRQPAAATGGTTTGDGPGAGGGEGDGDGEGGGDALVLPESLKTDLMTEQAAVIGSALAADPALAHDLLLFKTAADLLGRSGGVSWALGVTASRAERPHAKPDGVDGRAAEALAHLAAGLDLSWWSDGKAMSERFESFRALDADMKSRVVAVALADAVRPSKLAHGEPLMAHVARQVVPEVRAVWRPTGGAFFGRLKKSVLLGLLARELRQPDEAARLAGEKKMAVVDHLERLFAAPFATLTPEQREAVETWCPPGMAIPAPRERVPSADVVQDDAAEDEGDVDEAFDADPDEAFDVGPDEALATLDEVLADNAPETEAA